MEFTANTKPIVDGIDLAIISSNISKYYQKSCIVELTIEDNALRVNTEASSIKSEVVFKGKTSGEGDSHIFVDSNLFKSLLQTLDSDTITFDISSGVLNVIAGTSSFKLPQMISSDELELSRPTKDISQSYDELDNSVWDFVKDNQMYAISMSIIHPIYTHVWCGDSGDVIVGDFDNMIFTHSKKSNLSNKCLLTDTIINLLTDLPQGAKIAAQGKNYIVLFEADPYSYTCEFTPKYEEDEGVGDYQSEIISSLFEHPEEAINLNSSKLESNLAQASLFAKSSDEAIKIVCTDDSFTLINENVNCVIPVSNPFGSFESKFNISLLKDAISHMDSKEVNISPTYVDGEISGIVIYTDSMSTVLAGVEDGI